MALATASVLKGKIINVTRSKDGKGGILECIIPSTDHDISPVEIGSVGMMLIPVIYTSPYSFHNDGSFIAVPAPGTNILIQRLGLTYYYISSIVGDDGSMVEELSDWSDVRKFDSYSIDKLHEPLYDKRTDFPSTIVLRHPRGHRLIIQDNVGEEGPEHISKIDLRSGKGKIVSLDDSARIDCMRMGVLNGKGRDTLDGITIGHGKADVIGSRCIKVETESNITNISHEGEINNVVVEGRNYNIENRSMGKNADPFTGAVPNPLSSELENFGNISLGSQWKDINLVVGSPNNPEGDPQIIIEQVGNAGQVRINADGAVEIFAKSIDIKATEGDINLKSETGNVRIEAAGEFTANATKDCIMNSENGNCVMNSKTGVSTVKGTVVQLNPPTSVADVTSVTQSTESTEDLRQYVPFWFLQVGPATSTS